MAKYAARTTLLKRGDGAGPEVFATVPQVSSIDPVGSSRDLIDASAYGDDWKDYVLGQQDGDDLTVEMQYDPANAVQATLKDDYDDGTKRNWRLVHPEGTEFAFPAYITQWSQTQPLDGVAGVTMNLKIVNPGVTEVP